MVDEAIVVIFRAFNWLFKLLEVWIDLQYGKEEPIKKHKINKLATPTKTKNFYLPIKEILYPVAIGSLYRRWLAVF